MNPGTTERRPRKARKGKRRRSHPLRLLHHHAGYMRLQADPFAHEEAEADEVAKARVAVEAVPGVRRWSHNPATASVVVEYEPGAVDADALIEKIAKKTHSDGVEEVDSRSLDRIALVNVFLDFAQDVNRVVAKATGDRADLRELVPAAMLGSSIVSLVLGKRWTRYLPGRWTSNVYRAYRVFMNWHKAEIKAREKAERKTRKKRRKAEKECARVDDAVVAR
jgi:copper chaperone CopZ